jgi:hypothetical protein
MAQATLLDLARIDGGIGVGIIEEAVKNRQELVNIPSSTITGTSMELTVLTDLPTVTFRKYNGGSTPAKAKWTTKLFQTFPISIPVMVDSELVKAAKDPGRFLQAQSTPVMEGVLKHVCSQLWYGTSNDALGFQGILNQAETSATHVVDAGGSTAKTSIWMFATGTEKLEFIWGNNMSISMGDGWKEETVTESTGAKWQAQMNWIKGNVGFRLANKNAAIRIKSVGTDSGKGATDALLYSALTLMTSLGLDPTQIWMNPRSRDQWRTSRTATNADGKPAPLPRDFEGIPVYVTNALLNSET